MTMIIPAPCALQEPLQPQSRNTDCNLAEPTITVSSSTARAFFGLDRPMGNRARQCSMLARPWSGAGGNNAGRSACWVERGRTTRSCPTSAEPLPHAWTIKRKRWRPSRNAARAKASCNARKLQRNLWSEMDGALDLSRQEDGCEQSARSMQE